MLLSLGASVLFAIPHFFFSYHLFNAHSQSSSVTLFSYFDRFTLTSHPRTSTHKHISFPSAPLSLYVGFLSLGIAPLLIKEEKMEFFFPACGGLKAFAFAAGLVVGMAGMRGTGAGPAVGALAMGAGSF